MLLGTFMYKFLFGHIFFLLDIHLEEEVLGHLVTMFSIMRNCHIVFQRGKELPHCFPFYIPTSNVWRFQFLHILTNPWLLFSCSVVSNCLHPCGQQHARLPCPSPTPGACSNSFMELVMPSNHRILCCPLLLLLSIFPSIAVFSNESALCIRWPKYWSFSFSISPSNEYSGLISFRIDWLDPLAVQGIIENLLQNHSLKASILQHSAFFMVQLSYPYLTTRKTIAFS